MNRSLFKVPDVVTKMTRSLEMVDIKINILDDVNQTPDEFRGVPDNYRSAGGLSEPPGELMGLDGP